MLGEQKKDKTQRRSAIDWSRRGHRTGITQAMATKRLADTSEDFKELEKEQKEKRQLWLEADKKRHDAAVHVRKVIKSSEQDQGQTAQRIKAK